jgi:hypothetical protein
VNTTSETSLRNEQPKDITITQSSILAEFGKLHEIGDHLKPFERLRITDATAVPPPVPVITINGETISTEGNITTISGASKSGKSAFTGILIAGAISKDGIIDGLDGVQVQPNKKSKAILHFDTEQARHKHQYNLISILRRCEIDHCPDYFLSYNIRGLELNEYAGVTANICAAANEQFGGIHLIVIDGIADYISDVNDPVQSNAIVKYFEELAIKYSAPIIVIVHTNPGSDKERGHLGSQCQRKSESVIIVKTEGDLSFIEPRFLRTAGKGDIPLIQFMYDKNKGYHVGCGIRSNEQAGKDAERIAGIKKICSIVFSGQKAYGYKDAVDSIMKETNKALNTSKGLFAEMKAHEMIIQGADKNWRINASPNDNSD